MQLYHEDGYCCGPLAADAIRSFGGRDWSIAGISQTSGQPSETSGLRREVSMKVKKKHLISNQTFRDKSLKHQFIEPTTMCMESSYWRNPTHHRQSTPTTFSEHQPDVARHHSLDLRDLFEQLAISYRSLAVNTPSPKVNGVKGKPETVKKPQKLGLLTRNSRGELDGTVVNSRKKIFDAIAAASIFTNCAGIDTNNSQVITLSTFTKFLETRQMEIWSEEDIKALIRVLLTGCRCVELDCWDGDDGYPMIYHGHTFTTKIPFNAVVESIDKNAFVASPYPVILSIENHCSLQQQSRMAHTFQRVFGEKLVTSFLFDADYSDEPTLPSPEQLKHRILIKNKKLIMEVPMPLISYSAMSTPVSCRETTPGDNGCYRIATTNWNIARHIKGSSTKRPNPDDKLKKRSSQISKDLSDLVVYVQAIKFRGLNTISPNSSVKHKQRPGMSSSGSSIVTSSSTSTASNISFSAQTGTESDTTVFESEAKAQRPNANVACYHCSSINENTAKKLCRKQSLALVAHTQTQLMRTYPAGMRIDSSNFNPVIFWSFGIQMAALNYQTDDLAMQLNTALFESNGKCGFVSKPNVMWDRSHVMYRRFNPWDKEFDGLHSCQIVLNIVSGQYVCQTNVNVSTYVEVEIIGIPVDCNKQKTKIVQKNALNPIWNDTFHFRVLFHDLAFLRINVLDGTTNHLLAHRILPLKCLKPGYRHIRLRSAQNKNLNMSTLFIYSRVEEESLENNENRDTLDRVQTDIKEKPSDITMDSTYVGISGTPLCMKRKMFFLMVYGVVSEEPYTILKITQESTTQDVLILALQKAGQSLDKINDYILVEEVARGWEKKDHNLPATQRVLDLHERPLQAQSQWKGEGRFILKRMGDDPSSRAWLSSIRSVANREREARKSDGAPSNAWEENDTFLVCIYNVSPEIPYAILKVPLNACAQDVLAQALVKARRMEDPTNFVIVEELEWGGASHNIQLRALSDDENVYSAQSHWQTIGRFIMQDRAAATPNTLRKNRLTSTLRLATLDRISRGLSAARNVASNSIKVPVQVALSDPTTSSKFKSKTGEDSRKGMLRGKVHSEKDTHSTSVQQKSQCQREVHSEGETLSDDDTKESDLLSTVSRLKKVSLRKLKEWKS
ncbi:phosphoinositide-specific phospholipase c family protein [Holotrichia oblita]|uniref:Phosphoinositide-specific phospholipase c family protein n=1 Tax=Holotrichia oblita TaxID=644536 RepID=A0ACB9SUE6_HOLOL|nr:phosphoinositide-specific phospholipase c family protein [Holotrichia oblita]